jgi:hypothetical protein
MQSSLYMNKKSLSSSSKMLHKSHETEIKCRLPLRLELNNKDFFLPLNFELKHKASGCVASRDCRSRAFN